MSQISSQSSRVEVIDLTDETILNIKTSPNKPKEVDTTIVIDDSFVHDEESLEEIDKLNNNNNSSQFSNHPSSPIEIITDED